jgi:LysM repeat protein
MKRWVVKFSVLAVLCPILFFPAALSAQESLTVATAAEYEEGLIHTVVKGDTLWDLSAKYLGSPWVWPELWERNRFLTNPHYIYPGIKIVVYPPPPREYVMEIREPAREAVPAAAEPSEEVAAQPEGAAPSVDAPFTFGAENRTRSRFRKRIKSTSLWTRKSPRTRFSGCTASADRSAPRPAGRFPDMSGFWWESCR